MALVANNTTNTMSFYKLTLKVYRVLLSRQVAEETKL